ncbi:hypothetical protein AB0D49_21440 [Streptomyces sp. NPDC048290]|uniref:hypothetical protein n=1 Tax=Streptomyces sp. NPDC048290 TaxID=3155811 RepID=UPI003440E71F
MSVHLTTPVDASAVAADLLPLSASRVPVRQWALVLSRTGTGRRRSWTPPERN